MSKPNQKPKPLNAEIFYDLRDQSYWYRLTHRYVKMKKTDLKMHLRVMGYSDDEYVKTGNGSLPFIDIPFYEATKQRAIDYAGPLAGHRTGVFRDGGGRAYLITDEARGVWDDLPKGKVTEPEFFSEFVNELLPGDQSDVFLFWLSFALQSLREGDFSPGQAVVLAGPPKCGKSFLQDIVTEILGGRSANPFKYMMELTQFNNDLVGAEHWKIEDPPSSTDIRTRRAFGNNIKNCTFTRDFPVHPKGKDAQMAPVFRRITISVNDEPENLAVIPPLEASINDKLMLFHCVNVVKALARFKKRSGTPTLPGIETDDSDKVSRKLAWQKVIEEIPLIRAWLLKHYRHVPKGFRDDRCGIAYWHHPELVQSLCDLSPEHRLLQLIDYVYYDEPPYSEMSERKAFDIENELTKRAPVQTGSLARHNNWVGTYLGRLLKAGNPRISKRVLDGSTLWTIKPPSISRKESNG
jgi:hypothetical protein